MRVLLLSFMLIFSRRTTRRERREIFSATGSWITLIISQTQWQEMFSALAERRRLEKINISERALRGKFFSKFFPWIRKNPEGSSSKENLFFCEFYCSFFMLIFSRRTTRRELAENIFATGSWITLIISQTQWQEMFSALAERRRLEKINISERALRGKFSFEIFSVNTEKILKEVLRKKTSYFCEFYCSWIRKKILKEVLRMLIFRDARLAGKRREYFLPLGRE